MVASDMNESENSEFPRILDQRLAFVTGAGRGIGREIALGLSRAGANVIVCDLDGASADATAQEIQRNGGVAWAFLLDVRRAGDCDALAAKVEAEIGQVDLLINNAAIIMRDRIDSPNAANAWKLTFDVNVHGTFHVTHAFLNQIIARQGTIVNMASTASFIGVDACVGYAPSKGAIKQFTQSLAAELAPHGVRVNAIAPGIVATPLNAEAREDDDYLGKRLRRIPLGRIGAPKDLVGPAIFLSSSMSEYVTGVTLVVDGGRLAV